MLTSIEVVREQLHRVEPHLFVEPILGIVGTIVRVYVLTENVRAELGNLLNFVFEGVLHVFGRDVLGGHGMPLG